ncbi:Pyridoxal kinase [Vitis vinifera]|uniref:pyridoxal kinase n=1 Tax=Vitis vinifera TaxID=29760 RepID=A0A438CP48_VITVI|nr:Pyridoxal kinase [Vitis vinifera]
MCYPKSMHVLQHVSGRGHSPDQFKIVMPKIPAYFTGTGDLMTALLLGWSNVMLLNSIKYPDNLNKAAELAVSSLQVVCEKYGEDVGDWSSKEVRDVHEVVLWKAIRRLGEFINSRVSFSIGSSKEAWVVDMWTQSNERCVWTLGTLGV